tara:strand:+ start:444 stop:554 length:111 start_codon:yes stop_codon:yes gene_type:complete
MRSVATCGSPGATMDEEAAVTNEMKETRVVATHFLE